LCSDGKGRRLRRFDPWTLVGDDKRLARPQDLGVHDLFAGPREVLQRPKAEGHAPDDHPKAASPQNAAAPADAQRQALGVVWAAHGPHAHDLGHVLVGAEPTEEGAGQLAGRIRDDSLEKIVCFVVRIDSM